MVTVAMVPAWTAAMIRSGVGVPHCLTPPGGDDMLQVRTRLGLADRAVELHAAGAGERVGDAVDGARDTGSSLAGVRAA